MLNLKNKEGTKRIEEIKEKRGLYSIIHREEYDLKKEIQEENLSWNLGMLKEFQKSIIEKQT